jgi:hypothetical protein
MKWPRLRIDRTTAFIALAAVLLGVLYIAAATWVQGQFADTTPSTSSLSTSPVGLQVWRDYLERLGLDPQSLTDFTSLPASSTLIIATPFENASTPAEADQLRSWIERGGRAVVIGLDDGGLASTVATLTGDVSADTTSVVTPSFPGPYSAGVSAIAAGAGRFAVTDPGWVDLYADGQGVSVVTRAVGKGELVRLSDVEPVSNAGIGLRDDAAFAVRLAAVAGMRIYFDEYHHGVTTEVTAWGLLGPGGQAALVLLVAAALALILARGRRSGPPVAPVTVPAARGGAYIAQLAELYRTAGARAEALADVEDGLVRALVRRYGDRASGLARQPRARQAIEASAALRAQVHIDKQQFVAAAQALRAARKEVEGGNG